MTFTAHPKTIEENGHNESVGHVKGCSKENQEKQIDTQMIDIRVDQRVAEIPPGLVLLVPG